ncbi:MAG TPA: hypothetical protein ENI66_01120 [Candidatus Yonathbacteria bacterium]|nr:hypothetical protein [Candidatus Yonathbacteria bacterium]
MTKYIEREKAIKLRKDGHSYNYIADKTGASKGTLNCWLSDIPYIPNNETISRIGKARAKSGEVKSLQKLNSIKMARREAKNEINFVSKRDLFMLGLALYIGEGSKSYGIIRVINANPKVIKFMIKWFKEIFGMSDENFAIRLHLYPDNNEKECLDFWSEKTDLSALQFQKTQIDRRKNKKLSKRGKLPYGTAHLSVKSCGNKRYGVFLARKIDAYTREVFDLKNLRV